MNTISNIKQISVNSKSKKAEQPQQNKTCSVNNNQSQKLNNFEMGQAIKSNLLISFSASTKKQVENEEPYSLSDLSWDTPEDEVKTNSDEAPTEEVIGWDDEPPVKVPSKQNALMTFYNNLIKSSKQVKSFEDGDDEFFGKAAVIKGQVLNAFDDDKQMDLSMLEDDNTISRNEADWIINSKQNVKINENDREDYKKLSEKLTDEDYDYEPKTLKRLYSILSQKFNSASEAIFTHIF